MARISRESVVSGITRTMEISRYDQLEFERRYTAFKSGAVGLTEAFPDLSSKTLLFIQYGCTEEEWEKAVGKL